MKAILEYKKVKNVPSKLLDRILLETYPKELITAALTKEITDQKLKNLKLKHKIYPKKKVEFEQLIELALEYIEVDKTRLFYSLMMNANKRTFIKCMCEDCNHDEENLWGEEEFVDNINKLINDTDVPGVITYIRQEHEELHKYLPSLIKSWIESKDFLSYDIEDLYGFDYDETIEEEFGIPVDFEALSMIVKKSEFEEMLKESDDPLELGIRIAMEQFYILKGLMDDKEEMTRSTLETLDQEVLIRQKALQEARKDLKTKEDEIKVLKEKNEFLDLELNKTKKKLDSLNETVSEKLAKIEDMKKEKKLNNKELNAYKRQVEKELEEKNRKISDLEKELEESLLRSTNLEKESKEEIDKIRLEMEELIKSHKEQIKILERELGMKQTPVAQNDVSVTNNGINTDEMGFDFLDTLNNSPTY